MPDRNERGPDLVALLREADATLREQRLSAEADARLRRLVEGGPRRRWRAAVILLPAAVAATAALAWLLLPARPPSPGPEPGPRTLAGFSVTAGRAGPHARGGLACDSSECVVGATDARTRITLRHRTRVRRRGPDLELLDGTALFEVARRPAGARPLRVHVSHGRVEVLGTRFSLTQREHGGSLVLHEGAIRFVSSTGQATPVLGPGARLTWPLAEAEATAATTPPRAPRRRPAPARPGISPEEAETLFDQVARLRSQQRYAEAASLLRRALRRALPPVMHPDTRESFSFELGLILTQDLKDRAAACQHWREHLRRFGPARYGREIERARAEIGCDQ